MRLLPGRKNRWRAVSIPAPWWAVIPRTQHAVRAFPWCAITRNSNNPGDVRLKRRDRSGAFGVEPTTDWPDFVGCVRKKRCDAGPAGDAVTTAKILPCMSLSNQCPPIVDTTPRSPPSPVTMMRPISLDKIIVPSLAPVWSATMPETVLLPAAAGVKPTNCVRGSSSPKPRPDQSPPAGLRPEKSLAAGG